MNPNRCMVTGFSSPLGVLSIPTSIRLSTISGEIKKDLFLFHCLFAKLHPDSPKNYTL